MRFHCQHRAVLKLIGYMSFFTFVYVMYHVACVVTMRERAQLDGLFDAELTDSRVDKLPMTAVAEATTHATTRTVLPVRTAALPSKLPPNPSSATPDQSSEQERYYGGLRQRTEVVNPFNYSLIINEPTLCLGEGGAGNDTGGAGWHTHNASADLVMVIVVLSAAKNAARRAAIRDTWGRSHPRVKVVFLLGRSSGPNVNRSVARESRDKKDIVQFDVHDDYSNLVTKSALVLQWATRFCARAHYVMKTDDDMLLHVPHLVEMLNNLNRSADEHVLAGACVRGSNVYRAGRWRISREQYPFPKLPHYCTGSAYFFSRNTAELIYRTARTVPLMQVEDVFITGVVARVAGVTPRGMRGFPLWTTRYKQPCAFVKGELHGVHGLTPSKMHKVWVEINSIKC